jgi:hypothetical protein
VLSSSLLFSDTPLDPWNSQIGTMTEFETTPEHMLRHNVNDPETDFLNGKSLSVQIPGRLFVVFLISIVSIFNSKQTDE